MSGQQAGGGPEPPGNSGQWSPAPVTALIVAVTGLIGAITGLIVAVVPLLRR